MKKSLAGRRMIREGQILLNGVTACEMPQACRGVERFGLVDGQGDRGIRGVRCLHTEAGGGHHQNHVYRPSDRRRRVSHRCWRDPASTTRARPATSATPSTARVLASDRWVPRDRRFDAWFLAVWERRPCRP